MNKSEHKAQTISGLKWNILNQLITQGFTFTISLILMRLLPPEEFGLLGMVTVFSGFLTVFKNFGLNSSLIQKEEIDDVDKYTIFWTTVGLGFSLTFILFFSASPLSSFYGTPIIKNITRYISIIFFIQSIGSVHMGLLKKKLDYKNIFFADIWSVVISSAIAIIFAFAGVGVWALIYQQIVAAVIRVLVLWYNVEFYPKLKFSRVRLREHLAFSFPLVANNGFNYWSRNLDNLLIGRFLGSASLGLYSKTYGIMMLPVNRISGVISSVMFPSLSLIQNDKKRIKYIFLKISRTIAYFTFPMMGCLFVVAEPFVKVLFGQEWLAMIPILKIFCIVGAIQSIGTLIGNIFLVLGKTKLFFYVNTISSIIVAIAFVIGVRYGIYVVSISYLIAVLVISIPQFYITGKLIHTSILEMFINVKNNFLITIILAILLANLILYIEDVNNQNLLLIGVTSYCTAWWLLMSIFDKESIKEVLNLKTILLKSSSN